MIILSVAVGMVVGFVKQSFGVGLFIAIVTFVVLGIAVITYLGAWGDVLGALAVIVGVILFLGWAFGG